MKRALPSNAASAVASCVVSRCVLLLRDLLASQSGTQGSKSTESNPMDPVFSFPASPGTPLFPVSPERANRQQLPQSPSLPFISNIQNDPFILHSRGNSDVQGKVAQFNNLSKEAAQRRKDSEAALKRAVLGREEAESETRRLREENRLLRQDVEEGRARERRVGERVEAVMVGQPTLTDGFR